MDHLATCSIYCSLQVSYAYSEIALEKALKLSNPHTNVRLGRNYPLLDDIDAVVLTGSSKDVFCELNYNSFR